MDDKDNGRDVYSISKTAITSPSTLRCTHPPGSTSSNHSSGVYSNSHHTQIRRSTDNREEDLLLESEENARRQQYDFSGSRVRMLEPLAQAACFEKREEDDLARQTSSSNPHGELLKSIARPLENISLQSTTTCTPQQESCGRHFDDHPDGRLENVTQLRRGGLVDVERIPSK